MRETVSTAHRRETREICGITLSRPLEAIYEYGTEGVTIFVPWLKLAKTGLNDNHALLLIFNELCLDYVDYYLQPSQPLTDEERHYGRKVASIFVPNAFRRWEIATL